MNVKNSKQPLTLEQLDAIIKKYDSSNLIGVSRDISFLGDFSYAMGRLNRAAGDQVCADDATISRYALWIETVRDNIIYAMELFLERDDNVAEELIIRTANSLSAFYEIQTYFDPINLPKKS